MVRAQRRVSRCPCPLCALAPLATTPALRACSLLLPMRRSLPRWLLLGAAIRLPHWRHFARRCLQS